MTDDQPLPAPVERALEEHESFEQVDGSAYALQTTTLDARVTAGAAEGDRDGRFVVSVLAPALSAAVDGDAVADVVEDDWYETFVRRLDDVFSVATTQTHEPPSFERDGGDVWVRLEYVTWDAREGVADAKTLAEYVEGTYVQGLIPGYEYCGNAKTLLETAKQRGTEAAASDGDSASNDPSP